MITGAKYHGYGNDFLVFRGDQVREDAYAAFARSVCDPHFGIGGDGCVFLNPTGSDSFEFRIFNQDGSEAGMSGNGGRCAAAFLLHQGLIEGNEVKLETAAGPRPYHLLDSRYPVWRFRSQMGRPDFRAGAVPFGGTIPVDEVVGWPLDVGGETVEITALSVGNPQCAVMVDELPGEQAFYRLGKGLALHPAFPEGTNVSFVKVLDSGTLQIRIWERGVGPTHSSGTGCCGAAVAAIALGCAVSPVTVNTATGSQVVEWEPGGEIQLIGDAVFIARFEFEWS